MKILIDILHPAHVHYTPERSSQRLLVDLAHRVAADVRSELDRSGTFVVGQALSAVGDDLGTVRGMGRIDGLNDGAQFLMSTRPWP